MKKFALVLLFASMNSTAADFRNLYFDIDNDKKSCVMTEFGSKVMANPIKLKGKYYGSNECAIHLTADEFSKKFEFCALSGVKSFHPESSIECDVNYSTNEWVEFSQRGPNKCEFVCQTKSLK